MGVGGVVGVEGVVGVVLGRGSVGGSVYVKARGIVHLLGRGGGVVIGPSVVDGQQSLYDDSG